MMMRLVFFVGLTLAILLPSHSNGLRIFGTEETTTAPTVETTPGRSKKSDINSTSSPDFPFDSFPNDETTFRPMRQIEPSSVNGSYPWLDPEETQLETDQDTAVDRRSVPPIPGHEIGRRTFSNPFTGGSLDSGDVPTHDLPEKDKDVFKLEPFPLVFPPDIPKDIFKPPVKKPPHPMPMPMPMPPQQPPYPPNTQPPQYPNYNVPYSYSVPANISSFLPLVPYPQKPQPLPTYQPTGQYQQQQKPFFPPIFPPPSQYQGQYGQPQPQYPPQQQYQQQQGQYGQPKGYQQPPQYQQPQYQQQQYNGTGQYGTSQPSYQQQPNYYPQFPTIQPAIPSNMTHLYGMISEYFPGQNGSYQSSGASYPASSYPGGYPAGPYQPGKPSPPSPPETPGNFEMTVAVAVLSGVFGFPANPLISGTLYFTEIYPGIVLISGVVKGLLPGKHGLQILEYGDLTQGCSSLGEPYDPTKEKHGNINGSPSKVGDLGNCVADSLGVCFVNKLSRRFSIQKQLFSVIGRSIVVREKGDDLSTDPDGKGGKSIACGLIGLANTSPSNSVSTGIDKLSKDLDKFNEDVKNNLNSLGIKTK